MTASSVAAKHTLDLGAALADREDDAAVANMPTSVINGRIECR
jgi:hypothetical protein